MTAASDAPVTEPVGPLSPPPSDFLIFVDESGDHSLTSIDANYPLFVLTFCVVSKSDYAARIVPSFMDLKFEFFGHDMTVLHAHEIRKPRGDFTFLLNAAKRARFMERMNTVIEQAPFTIISTVIRKIEHKKRYPRPQSPYDLALRFCMERVFSLLWDRGQAGSLTHIIAESRGRAEDADLELEFRRVCQNVHDWPMRFRLDLSAMPFDLVFAQKQANAIGLQLADLVAQPIGRHVLKPDQPNRSFDIIASKFMTNDQGKIRGWGLKIFP